MPYEDEVDENDKSLDEEIKELTMGQEVPPGAGAPLDADEDGEAGVEMEEEAGEENADTEEV